MAIAQVVNLCHIKTTMMNNFPWANVLKGADAKPRV